MSSNITIGNLVFKNRVNAVEVKSTWGEITRTATIRIPRYKKLVDPSQTAYKIKPGDPVVIRLGYNDTLQEEFSGYVASVSPQSPLQIVCEDEMWKLKQETVTQSWPSISLKNLILYLVPGANVDTVWDIDLKPFRLNQVTKATALQKLKEDYNLVIYFRGTQLYAGLAYNEPNMPLLNYDFQQNAVADQLIFRSKDQIKLSVKAVSILPDNTRIEAKVGDETGEQRTLTFYNIRSESELRRQATEKLEGMQYDGLSGTFMGFGLPFADHGYTVKLKDARYKERNTVCVIDSVVTTYDSNGYHRVITPGKAVGL